MHRTMITVAALVGLVALLVPIVLLWHTLTSFTITSHPLFLSSPGSGQVSSIYQANGNDIMLVMSNPKQLGGVKASTTALGSPQFLGQAVEAEPLHVYDSLLECTPWTIYRSDQSSTSPADDQILRRPLTIWPNVQHGSGFVSMWELLAYSGRL